MAGGMMDLFDILLVKKLIGKFESGEITSPEAQVIIKQLEEKASKDEMKAYVAETIENLPALSSDDILNLTK